MKDIKVINYGYFSDDIPEPQRKAIAKVLAGQMRQTLDCIRKNKENLAESCKVLDKT